MELVDYPIALVQLLLSIKLAWAWYAWDVEGHSLLSDSLSISPLVHISVRLLLSRGPLFSLFLLGLNSVRTHETT